MTNSKIIFGVLVFIIFFVPVFVFAQSISIPCDDGNCSLGDLIGLVQQVINFVIMVFAPIAMLLFAWAGFLMVTASGNQGQVEKAKKIFTSVAVGFIIVLSAWLIVYTIMKTLLDPEVRRQIPIELQLQ